MNQQMISLSKTRAVRLLALALPIGVLLLTQACARPPSRYGESPKSTPVAASEIAPSVENYSFKK